MYHPIKRTFDIFVSIITLLILSVLLLPVMIVLRLTAEGKVFYFQERIGLYNRRFQIWKFATMLQNSPNLGSGMITLRNDFRVTKAGKFLRMTKLNELPQIVNVLTGDMSIVGPRPLVDRTFNAYPAAYRNEIYNVKPGITGIGSIVFRDEEKLLSVEGVDPHELYQTHIAPYKGELELWYQRNASMKTDLLIIFLTAWQIFFPHSDLAFRMFSDLPQQPHFVKTKGEVMAVLEMD